MMNFRPVLALLMSSLAGAAQAQLTLVLSDALVQTGGPGIPDAFERDPWLVNVTAGTSFGEASIAAGTFRASAEWLPSYTFIPSGQIAYASGDISLRNTGPAPIAVGPISALFDATLTQTPDADTGSLRHFVIGVVAAQGAGLAQAARADYTLNAFRLTPGGPITEQLTTDLPTGGTGGGGVGTIFTATRSSFEAGLSLPGFVLAPGQVMRVLFSLQTGTFGSDGWGAMTDASQSAQLFMQIPAGVTVHSAQPLTWISAVPEPGSTWLLLAGAGALGLVARRRPRA